MNLWRIASNILPTKVVTSAFNSSADIMCSLCNTSPESITHLFWECSLARVLWYGCKWCIRTEFIQVTSAIQLIETLIIPPNCFNLEKVEVEQFIVIGAIIFDQLWKIRNAKIHEANDADAAIINQQIHSHFKEFWAGRKPKSKTLPSFVHQPIKTTWAAPSLGTIQVNCDAAIGPNFSSIAVVAQDWRGNLVLALFKKAKTTIPLQAEVEAILLAIQLVGDSFWPLVIFESDSLICINALRGESLNYSWRISGCISRILLYSDTNPSWSFSWTKRETNVAPHMLARWSLRNKPWGPVFFGSGPRCFLDVYYSDQSHLN